MAALMSHDEYGRWWNDATDAAGELLPDLPEPVRTLAAHVMALQGRLDRLPGPDDHDRAHGHACRCSAAQCACAYDHPDAVCMTHRAGHDDAPLEELTPSQTAAELGVSASTVRRYEERGILAPARRLPGRGDRRYARAAVTDAKARIAAEGTG